MTRIDEIRDRLDKVTRWLNLTKDGNVTSYDYVTMLVPALNDLTWCLDKLYAIRAVLGEEPDPCPEHPDDDPITCGWKRDILDIRHILNDTKENRA